MPELARFFGIIIRMYAELGAPHHVPHFHAYYQDAVAIYSIEPIELISGSFSQTGSDTSRLAAISFSEGF
jgi:Domain of unknown function (DUF4160)